jgi:DNA adenine methylase
MTYTFSILKSPGSKGWFTAHAEAFVLQHKPHTVVEPFAGSAVVGLTLLNRGYAKRLVLAERDPELRQFWSTAVSDADFAGRVSAWTHKFLGVAAEDRHQFAVDSAARMAQTDPAFSVLLRSRYGFNGILRQGMVSTNPSLREWWPVNLGTPLKFLYDARNRIELFSDAFEALRAYDRHDSYGFIDPPYTAGKCSPGHDLYRMSQVDHEQLIRLMATWTGSWQLTSEFCPEVLRLLRGVRFEPPVQRVVTPMRTVNGRKKMELVLSRGSRLGCNKAQRVARE